MTWQEIDREVKSAVLGYMESHKIDKSQMQKELSCSFKTINGLINENVLYTLESISFIEDKLNFNLGVIKSHIGSSPILFNCSSTSGFIYRVVGCDKEGMHKLNHKEGFLDIISAIKQDYELEYVGCRNEIFEQNIRIVDSRMDEILQNAILLHIGYVDGLNSTSVSDMCNSLAELNPIGAGNPQFFYAAKLKAFLFASFAGMTASTEWSGRKKLTGGYIDVDREGELLYYRAISDDIFENYLFMHTYVDRPDRGANKSLAVAEANAHISEGRSLTETERNRIIYKNGRSGTKNSKKGDFGYVYKEGENFYIAVNFQIRFR